MLTPLSAHFALLVNMSCCPVSSIVPSFRRCVKIITLTYAHFSKVKHSYITSFPVAIFYSIVYNDEMGERTAPWILSPLVSTMCVVVVH